MKETSDVCIAFHILLRLATEDFHDSIKSVNVWLISVQGRVNSPCFHPIFSVVLLNALFLSAAVMLFGESPLAIACARNRRFISSISYFGDIFFFRVQMERVG